MLEVTKHFLLHHPLDAAMILGGCIGAAFIVFTVFKQILNLDLWNQ